MRYELYIKVQEESQMFVLSRNVRSFDYRGGEEGYAYVGPITAGSIVEITARREAVRFVHDGKEVTAIHVKVTPVEGKIGSRPSLGSEYNRYVVVDEIAGDSQMAQ